jgi:hypothetical protein
MAVKSKCVVALLWLLFLIIAGRAQIETAKTAGAVPLLLQE